MSTENQLATHKKVSISTMQLEAIYSLGFELYATGHFEKAADLFRLLCLYQPEKSRNWIALGGANHEGKDYESAIAALVMASFEDPLNPEPRLYSAHSCIDLMDLPAAREATREALKLCEKRNDTDAIKIRVLSLLEALESFAAA